MNNPPQPNTCPQCHAVLPADAPQGLCPACLLAAVALPTEAGTAAPAKAPPPTREQVAAAFPQLEILELIGAGGMGYVFKARQPKLDRLVALKLLPQSLAADAAFAGRFEREGRVLARLSHPNIVTVHDFGFAPVPRAGDLQSPFPPATSAPDGDCKSPALPLSPDAQPETPNPQPETAKPGFYYLLMEFVDGVNLRQAMRAGRFTPVQALEVVPKICEALQFAHEQGILHRDIKPENILLDAKGRVKLVDFGIAKLVDDGRAELPLGLDAEAAQQRGPATLTSATAALGTPSYMAPEQRDHPAEVDHRADIYSLGVVFYEMLTGELPVGKFAPPSAKSASDPRVDEVVLRALEQQRERRQQSAGEVKTQVENITSIPRIPEASNSAPKAVTNPLTVEADHSRALLTCLGWGVIILAGVLLAIFNPWGRTGWTAYTVTLVAWGFFSQLFRCPPNLKAARVTIAEFDQRVPMFGIALWLLAACVGLAAGRFLASLFPLGMALVRIYKLKKRGSGATPSRGPGEPHQSPASPSSRGVFLLALEQQRELRQQSAGEVRTQVESIASTPAAPKPAAPPPTYAQNKTKDAFVGPGFAVQVLGIVCLLIPFIGLFLGIVLIIIGTQMAVRVFCTNCGQQAAQDAGHCEHCNAIFTGPPPRLGFLRRSVGWGIFLGALATLALAIGLTMVIGGTALSEWLRNFPLFSSRKSPPVAAAHVAATNQPAKATPAKPVPDLSAKQITFTDFKNLSGSVWLNAKPTLGPGESFQAWLVLPDGTRELAMCNENVFSHGGRETGISGWGWQFQAPFSSNRTDEVVTQLRERWYGKNLACPPGQPVTVFTLTNEAGLKISGEVQFNRTTTDPAQPAVAAVMARSQMPFGSMLRFTSTVPDGHSLHVRATGTETHAAHPVLSRSASKYSTDAHCSWHWMDYEFTSLQSVAAKQMQALFDKGPLLVTNGQPRTIFSVTNANGKTYSGQFELRGPGFVPPPAPVAPPRSASLPPQPPSYESPKPSTPEGLALMTKLRAHYEQATNLLVEGHTVTTMLRTNRPAFVSTNRFELKLGRPELYQVRWTSSPIGSHVHAGAAWSAGDAHWSWMNGSTPEAQASRELALGRGVGVSKNVTGWLPSLFFGKAPWVQVLGDLKVEPDAVIEGELCSVLVGTAHANSTRLWISKRDAFLRQAEHVTTITSEVGSMIPVGALPPGTTLRTVQTYRRVTADQRLSADDFKFTPSGTK